MKKKIDLHTHTNYSDGDFSPKELIKLAQSRNINVLSITDHDSFDGYLNSKKLKLPKDFEIVPGLEISSSLNGKEVHLLGYFFDPEADILQNQLEEIKAKRLLRAKKIIKKLNSSGVKIDIEQVKKIAGNSAICRPHIAHAMVNSGIVKNYYIAFKKFLRDDGPADVKKDNISSIKAITVIHKAKGLVFIAHPVLLKDSEIEQLLPAVDGIETIHPLHNKYKERKYKNYCKRYSLLESGGSDFHSKKRGDLKNLGKFTLPERKFNSIKERRHELYDE